MRISNWCFVLLIQFGLVSFAAGQNAAAHKMEKHWSPPDKSFSIEVPVELHEIKGEYEDQSQDLFSSIRLFGSSEGDISHGVFKVVVLRLSKRNKSQGIEKLKGLESLIGGDEKEPSKTIVRKVAGLSAKEVLFVEETRCNKGLIIDGGKRVYVLGLSMPTCQQLDSAVADRFFKSFHLR